MMNRRRGSLIVAFAFAFALALAGCGGAGPSAAGTSTTTTSATASSSSVSVLSPAATTVPSDAATPIPTLVSTTETASAAPAGALPIKLTVTNGNPRFEPDTLTARAGAIVLYLENGANVLGTFDHNMRIGPAIGQILAGTPRIYGNSNVTFTVQGLAPGSYVYWCSIAGLNGLPHSTYGMVGRLTVAP